MFDSLKSLIVYNIQSHKKTILHFNRTGVHRLRGENSHGKSVIFKALYALFLGESLDSTGRNELIREEEEYGLVIATSYSGITFVLHLHLESSKCYYELQQGEQKIRKYLSDDYKTLLKAVNFHYLPEVSFSLNRYKTKHALPFTHTSGTLNYKIFDSASEVPEARKAIETYDENLRIIKEDKQVVERKIISLSEQFHLMDDSGISQLEDKLAFLKSYFTTYTEMKPITESLNSAIAISKEIAGMDLRDYKEAELVLPELRIIDQMKNSLRSAFDAEEEKRTLLEESRKEPIDLSELLAQLRILKETTIRLSDWQETEVALTAIEVGPPIQDITPILNEGRKLLQMNHAMDNLLTTNADIDSITIKPLHDITSVLYDLDNLSSAGVLLQKREQLERELNELSVIPRRDETAVSHLLHETLLLNDTQEVLSKIGLAVSSITQEQNALTVMDSKLVSLNKSIGNCPTCGEKLSSTRHRSHQLQKEV